ncbi:hypothetical protein JQX13_00155 [Archangium violaceum]|uniref:hypothetical protein n=1 Tax=Archangium violaceum TaxID=83451 RepID=UPI00193C1F71|nr:hypothetical protein [Archangium violaceum]QRK08644.1 hypothetical protein JQX13_00155 [Archangium violaceum]
MVERETTQFLNVDLDLRCSSGVRNLVRELEPSTLVMRLNDTEATLEHKEQPRSVDEALLWLVQLVESLPPEARALWDSCDARTMNVGIQAGEQPHQALFPVSLDAMASLLRIKADLLVTVYAVNR